MFLAGRPSAEYAFLREFLKADPNRELVSFVILRNPENPSPAPDRELSLIPFPVDEIFGRALPQFDLFILENFSAARFRLPPQYLDALKRFVAGGGALLVMGGENAFSGGGYRGSPLEELLPVALSGREPDFVPGLFGPKAASFEHPLLRLEETPEAAKRAWDALPRSTAGAASRRRARARRCWCRTRASAPRTARRCPSWRCALTGAAR